MGNVVQNVTSTTASTELQSRNGQDHQRVYDPTNNALFQDVLSELKELNKTLKIIYNIGI
jgi:hypothetical protein